MKPDDILKKAKAIVRRGLPSLRNVLFSKFDYWPVSSLGNHWLTELPIYCINLRRAARRRSNIEKQAQHLGLKRLTFVEAFDAAGSTLDALIEQGQYDHRESLKWHARGLTVNEVACSLSHLSCYRQIAAESSAWSLVIEDDALFRSGRIRGIDLVQIPTWADLVFLNAFYERTPPAGHLTGSLFADSSYGGSGAAYMLRRETAIALLGVGYPVVHAADGLLGRALDWPTEASPHDFRQQGCSLRLKATMVFPEAVTNGSTEHYYRSSLR